MKPYIDVTAEGENVVVAVLSAVDDKVQEFTVPAGTTERFTFGGPIFLGVAEKPLTTSPKGAN